MFNLFKKSYKTMVTIFGNTPYYETRYSTYIKTVYRNPSVATAYEKIENAYTNIEFKVFKREKKNIDGKQIVKFVPSENDWVNKSLNFPSDITTRTEFMEFMLFYHTFGGRLLLQKCDGIYSSDLFLYAPDSFEVEYNTTKPKIDKITIAGNKDIIGKELTEYHVMKSMDPTSQIAGVGAGSPKIESVASLVDLVNFTLMHNISLAKNKGNKSGYWKSTSEQRLTMAEREEMTQKLKAATEGYQNAGKSGILPTNIEFISTETAPKDMDWIKGWELAHRMIAGIMGVPLTMVDNGSSTYNNSKEDKIKLYKNTVIPIAKKHAEFLTKVFKDQLKSDEFIWIDLSTIEELRSETMETFKSLNDLNYITVNEKRSIISELTGVELGRYNNENADKLFTEMSKVLIDDVGVEIGPIDEGE